MKQISMAGERIAHTIAQTGAHTIAQAILAMTGRRSPWGGAGGGGSGDADGSGPKPENTPEEQAPDDHTPAQGDPVDPIAPPPAPPGEGHATPTPAPAADQPDRPAADETPTRRGGHGPWGQRGTTGPRSSAPRSSGKRPGAIEEMFRPRRPEDGSGGSPGGNSGGGMSPPFRLPPRANGKSWLPLMAAGLAALWLLGTGVHQLASTEQGIVTTFGKYTRTIGPGVSLTLPWPVQTVATVDVTSIRRDSIPDGEAEKLMLTSDQNLVDFSYLVRWSIKDLKLYTFQLDDPDATVREVAEAAMRASVSEVPLNDVMGGAGRSEIEQSVRTRMQAILDAYRSGVLIQGVDIKKADPPEKVVAAFQQVTVAQQGAQRDMSNAQAFAQQVVARAQGDAAAFDKVYAQYKLSPVVTRRRMYYETMERVLSTNDKVIMEGNTTSYLPLPEARRRSGTTVETGAGGQ